MAAAQLEQGKPLLPTLFRYLVLKEEGKAMERKVRFCCVQPVPMHASTSARVVWTTARGLAAARLDQGKPLCSARLATRFGEKGCDRWFPAGRLFCSLLVRALEEGCMCDCQEGGVVAPVGSGVAQGGLSAAGTKHTTPSCNIHSLGSFVFQVHPMSSSD